MYSYLYGVKKTSQKRRQKMVNNKKISPANKEKIKEFENRLKLSSSVGESTIENQMQIVDKFAEFLELKKFTDATEHDILTFKKQYSKSTQKTYLVILKKFYRWLYNLDKDDKLPDCIRKIETVRIKRDKAKEYKRVITPDEYIKLVDSAKSTMHKAIIETLYNFGMRVSELLSMRIGEVEYNNGRTKIVITESKTDTRNNYCVGRLENLLKWIETYHPYKDKPENKVWLYEGKNKVITELTRSGILQLLGRVSSYANLNKRVNCHDFRHTSISRDRKNGVPQSIIEQKHGLAHGSKMMGVYDHTGDTEYEKYILNKSKNSPETYESLKQENKKIKTNYEERIKTLEESKLDLNSKAIKELIDNQVESRIDKFLKETIPKIKAEMQNIQGI